MAEIGILVGEDSQGGEQLWGSVQDRLEEAIAPHAVTVTVAPNAAEVLARLARMVRAPHLIVLDLHLPLRASRELAREEPVNVGIWLARRIRADGHREPRLVLWTANVATNELNEAYAFCRLPVGDETGRPVGDYVIDKTAPAVAQATQLAALLGDSPPAWSPPPPAIHVPPAPQRCLPHLEAGLRPQAIASALHYTTATVRSWQEDLAAALCPPRIGADHDRSTAIVRAARAARIPWIPLAYTIGDGDPLVALDQPG